MRVTFASALLKQYTHVYSYIYAFVYIRIYSYTKNNYEYHLWVRMQKEKTRQRAYQKIQLQTSYKYLCVYLCVYSTYMSLRGNAWEQAWVGSVSESSHQIVAEEWHSVAKMRENIRKRKKRTKSSERKATDGRQEDGERKCGGKSGRVHACRASDSFTWLESAKDKGRWNCGFLHYWIVYAADCEWSFDCGRGITKEWARFYPVRTVLRARAFALKNYSLLTHADRQIEIFQLQIFATIYSLKRILCSKHPLRSLRIGGLDLDISFPNVCEYATLYICQFNVK